MKTVSITLVALTIVLLLCSTASAAWVHVGPAGVVYRAGPSVYAYRAGVTFVAPAPVLYPATPLVRPVPVVVYPPIYPRPVHRPVWYVWP
jgi:hypothetical protein